MIIKARGLLAHHFHGNYWCQIVLEFDNKEEANDALAILNNVLMEEYRQSAEADEARNWEASEKLPYCLIWSGTSAELECCKKVLGSYGADVDKIDSLAKSVDRGEPFEIAMAVDTENHNQGKLF